MSIKAEGKYHRYQSLYGPTEFTYFYPLLNKMLIHLFAKIRQITVHSGVQNLPLPSLVLAETTKGF